MKLPKDFFNAFNDFARSMYSEDFIPLHRPVFNGNEKKYLNECIDSNFVSSAGKMVTKFEDMIAEYTGAKYAVATVNGTSALHAALKISNVGAGDEVITQAFTFVATCNAINYLGADPVFIDVDRDTLGMSPKSLKEFLDKNVEIVDKKPVNKHTRKKISACVPMHSYGFPCRIDKITEICKEWSIPLIEDAAESLGSFFDGKHTGTYGDIGTLSFNGNKILTTGGGGMIITNNEELARKAKHITTTSKIDHPYKFFHDEVGFNYRLPNINAALGCAQMEQIEEFLIKKERIHVNWKNFLDKFNLEFVEGIKNTKPNYWLNVVILDSKNQRDVFLEKTNHNKTMTRPAWELMTNLPAFKLCQNDGIKKSKWLFDRVVNIPSSVP